MKILSKTIAVILFIFLVSGNSAFAQKPGNNSKNTNNAEMKTYIIEREIPGAGKLTEAQLKGISQTSCAVLKEMGPRIQWVHSYVTGDKIFCIYKAESVELVKEHAKKGGFPANVITEVATVISPATADE